jgi:hypothetical protein
MILEQLDAAAITESGHLVVGSFLQQKFNNFVIQSLLDFVHFHFLTA